MVPAVRPLGSLSMAGGCARIDSRPDTAKLGSADRVEVHHLQLSGYQKRFHTAWARRMWLRIARWVVRNPHGARAAS
jgi:hypothetical protein